MKRKLIRKLTKFLVLLKRPTFKKFFSLFFFVFEETGAGSGRSTFLREEPHKVVCSFTSFPFNKQQQIIWSFTATTGGFSRHLWLRLRKKKRPIHLLCHKMRPLCSASACCPLFVGALEREKWDGEFLKIGNYGFFFFHKILQSLP